MAAIQYYFDNYRFDPASKSLYRGMDMVPLELKVAETLSLLLERNGTVVSKAELFNSVWPNTVVGESVLRRHIALLRAVFAEDDHAYIETVPRLGFRFHAQVSMNPQQVNDTARPANGTTMVQPRRILSARRIGLILTFAVVLIVLSITYFPVRHTTPEFIAKQVTTNSLELPILAAALSRDGNMIASANQSQLLVSDRRGLEHHPLALPKGFISNYIEWFPDNVHLLLSGYSIRSHLPEIWRFSVLRPEAEQLFSNATNATVSEDSQSIAFIRNSNELWIASSDGHEARLFTTLTGNETFTTHPQFSADGAYILDGKANNADQHSTIEVRNIESGAVKSLFDADDYILGFCVLPGNELLVSRQPDRSIAESEVTLFRFNPATGTHTALQQIPSLPDHMNSKFTASRDGRSFAFINTYSQSDVYVSDLGGDGKTMSNARRLTLNESRDRPSGWLADSNTVLFNSYRSGRDVIYKQAIDSTDEKVIVDGQHGSFRAIVTHDQKWLFFFDVSSSSTALMRRSLAGGVIDTMDTRAIMYGVLHCAARANSCVLADYSDEDIRFVQFDPERGRGRELAKIKWVPTYTSEIWDLSPDGTKLAYIDNTKAADVINILDLSTQPAVATSVHVADRDPLRTLYWDAFGTGFYTSAYDTNGQVLQLLHIALDGSTSLLRTQANTGEGWAIPSPDGKHLAYQQWTMKGNIWLLQRQ